MPQGILGDYFIIIIIYFYHYFLLLLLLLLSLLFVLCTSKLSFAGQPEKFPWSGL